MYRRLGRVGVGVDVGVVECGFNAVPHACLFVRTLKQNLSLDFCSLNRNVIADFTVCFATECSLQSFHVFQLHCRLNLAISVAI